MDWNGSDRDIEARCRRQQGPTRRLQVPLLHNDCLRHAGPADAGLIASLRSSLEGLSPGGRTDLLAGIERQVIHHRIFSFHTRAARMNRDQRIRPC
jgi:hypothetical protein